MKYKFFYKGRFIFIPLGIAACLTVAGFAVMLLWNNLLPDILFVNTITFWQAVGIFILCKILFGFGRGGGRGCGPFGGARGPWMRHKMQEKMAGMTPEERDAFKQKMRERCGNHPFAKKWNDWAEEAKKDDQ